MSKLKTLSIVVIAAIALSSCGGGNKAANSEGTEESALSGSISIDGSSTVYPITEAVAEEFREVAPKVKVTVGVSGTGGGFKKFSRGEIDISDASRSIKNKEITSCEENQITYVELAVAYDGLAVIVNPANTWVDYFTVEELKKLWEPSAQGTIMKWSQIRAGWPDEEVHLFGPGTASGTYDYFAEAICGKKVGTRGDYNASEDDNVLVQGISRDKFGLGFFGLAYFEENADKLKLVGVDNGSGVIKPSLETVGNGTYAPLSRPIFIYVSNKGAAKPEVKKFVNFYLDIAAELATEVGYIPLPKEESAKQVSAFENFCGN
ncbi:MAG: phosphate transport system substrate-binding protein [Glaciecola sp.]|jgi:phosphate transport system substrate-binding protein